LVVALPIVVLFGPACFTDSSFATRDAGHFYYPLFHWTAEEWGAGRLPLWNPLEGGGSPVVADASSSVFYPGKVLFALPLPFALRFKLYVVAHVCLAAAGAYRLAKALSCSGRAAVLTAVAYSCGGSVAFQYSNVVFLVSAALLPWALLAMLSGMRSPSWASAVGLAMVLALMVLGGDPQMVVHVGLCALLYLVMYFFVGETSVATPALAVPRKRQYGHVLIRACLLLASLAVAFALSAVQVLPAREAAEESTRAASVAPRNIYELAGTSFGRKSGEKRENERVESRPGSEILHSSGAHSHQSEVYDFSIGPWRFAELFWPNVFGRMFPTHRRWLNKLPGEGRIWTPTIYLGLLTSILGLWQLRLRSTDAIQRWLSWICLLFALGSLGWYGLGWVVRELYGSLLGGDSSRIGVAQPVGGVYWFLVTFVPGYVQFRYPAKLLVVASLAFSLLAAKGWDEATRVRSRGLITMLTAFASLSFIGLLTSFVVAGWFSGREWKPDPVFGPFDVGGALWDIRLGLLQTFLVASLALSVLRKWQDRCSVGWANFLLIVVGLDLAVANAWIVATAPSETWNSEAAITLQSPDAVSRSPRLYRVRASDWWPPEFESKSSPSRMAQICAWEHDTLFPKHHLLVGVALADSSSSLRPADRDSFWRVARQLGHGGLVPHDNALRLTGVQFLLTPPSFVPLRSERWDGIQVKGPLTDDVRLWKIPNALPDAWIVHRVSRLDPLPPSCNLLPLDQRTRAVLLHGDQPRDFSRSAVVETTDSLPLADSGDEQQPAPCDVVHESPQRFTVTAELAQPGLLVINQSYTRGWAARMQTQEAEGKELPILRTNRILQGVVLPAGKHTVEFSYEPTSIYVGAVISSLAWLAALSAIAIKYARHRRS